MPIDDREMEDRTRGGISTLLARAAAADVRADEALHVAIDDVFFPDAARLEDRIRHGVTHVLRDLANGIAAPLRRHAARLLTARDEGALAELLLASNDDTGARLAAAGSLRDAQLMREIVGRVRQEVVADALPTLAREDPDTSSLLPRLLYHADPVVGSSAAALLAAESRRRIGGPLGAPLMSDLPAELHHRLAWLSAAALREQFAKAAGAALPALDRALAEAAMRSIATQDENQRLEAVALRLAEALEPTPGERAVLLVEALLDRRLALFIAIIAQGLGLDFADARDVVLDPDGARLWLLLRALDLDRATIARVGLSLGEADPRRDLDGFAEALDTIVAIDPLASRQALAPMLLHRDYRAALTALARGQQRSASLRDWIA